MRIHRKFAAALLAGLVALAPGTAARAQQLLESYVAVLSWNDHFNSRGARLTEPWQIIRQDRANFHRFGVRDPGDEWDSFFASMENRAAMERMLMNGFIDPGVAKTIVNNEVAIQVEIWGRGGTGNFVRVNLY